MWTMLEKINRFSVLCWEIQKTLCGMMVSSFTFCVAGWLIHAGTSCVCQTKRSTKKNTLFVAWRWSEDLWQKQRQSRSSGKQQCYKAQVHYLWITLNYSENGAIKWRRSAENIRWIQTCQWLEGHEESEQSSNICHLFEVIPNYNWRTRATSLTHQ